MPILHSFQLFFVFMIGTTNSKIIRSCYGPYGAIRGTSMDMERCPHTSPIRFVTPRAPGPPIQLFTAEMPQQQTAHKLTQLDTRLGPPLSLGSGPESGVRELCALHDTSTSIPARRTRVSHPPPSSSSPRRRRARALALPFLILVPASPRQTSLEP